MANFNGTLILNGLGTNAIFTAPEAGLYTVRGKLSLPSIVAGNGASAVVCLVKKGGVTQYTSNAGDRGFMYQANLASGDVITLVTSSSNANDNVLNAVKINVNFWEGLQ